MSDTPTRALKALRDRLKEPIPDVESLVEILETCWTDLDLDLGLEGDKSELVRRGIQRYLPSIQIILLSEVYPTFQHALDDDQSRLLERFFCVPAPTGTTSVSKISRWIGLTSYLTLPPFLNASHTPSLPIPARSFILDILDQLGRSYNIDEMYHAVWTSTMSHDGGQRKRTGPQDLIWDEVVKSIAGVPAKSANAVGRWKAEGWIGDLPDGLDAKSVVSPRIHDGVGADGQAIL